MANYYMIITDMADYIKDVKNQFQCAGFGHKNKKSIAKMQPGDMIVYYVTKQSKFCAVVEVTGKSYIDRTPIWSDPVDLWEYRVPTKPIIFNKSYYDGVYIKDIWDNLDLITNKGKWGSQVMGSFRILTENDYKTILKAIKKKQNKL